MGQKIGLAGPKSLQEEIFSILETLWTRGTKKSLKEHCFFYQ